MNALPRRSPRLLQQAERQYYNTQNTDSSTSTTSQSSPTYDFVSLQQQFYTDISRSTAPINHDPFLANHNLGYDTNTYTMSSQTQTQPKQSTAQHSHSNSTQSTQARHNNSFSATTAHPPTFGPRSNTQAPQGDLLAEAAKRAQMACLMRDMGDIGLS